MYVIKMRIKGRRQRRAVVHDCFFTGFGYSPRKRVINPVMYWSTAKREAIRFPSRASADKALAYLNRWKPREDEEAARAESLKPRRRRTPRSTS